VNIRLGIWWAEKVARMRLRELYIGFGGETEGPRVLGRPNFRWVIILKLISEQGQLRAVVQAVFNIHIL
jgi:hypothetical protein